MFGKMLLLNYQHFYEDEERRGSDKDVQKLDHLFKKFGFCVRPGEDLTLEETDKKINEFVGEVLRAKCDMIIVAIMSHGRYGDIFTCSDSKEHSLNDVIKYEHT